MSHKRLTFSVQELPQGGFIMLDGNGEPLRAFSTLDEIVGRVTSELRNGFAGSSPETIARRYAPKIEQQETPTLPLPTSEGRGFLKRMAGM